MADTYTTRNRFEKMEPGAYADTWASRVNGQFGSDLIDAAMDGVLALTVSGSVTLSTANGSSDQARYRCLNITGTGGTVTIPNLEKCYMVRNASSGTVTFTTGSGASAAVLAGTSTWVFSTGSNAVYATAVADFGAATVNAAGLLAVGTVGIGYATGAGGTVTQATNKTTAVTINKICGIITMNNAALAGGSTALFFLNNSLLDADDIFNIQVSSGVVSSNTYQVWVGSTTAGTVGINVKNVSGGSLSEAIVLSFAITKVVTS